jgi:PHP family Zn ribbon phosphoesterase
MPSKEDAKAQLRRDLTRIIDETRAEFEGKYGEELKALLELSAEELEEIAPRLESTEVYAQLIAVVRNASVKNLSVARLKARIRALGEVAVAIARKVPGLDRLFG